MLHDVLVLVHVLTAGSFLLSHGVSMSVTFVLRGERDPARVRALLDASQASYPSMYGSLIILFLTGVLAGFTGSWWSRGWIWLSLVLLLVIAGAMYAFGVEPFSRLRKAVGLPYRGKRGMEPAVAPASDDEIAEAIAGMHAERVAFIGLGGLAILLWLMRFKPF